MEEHYNLDPSERSYLRSYESDNSAFAGLPNGSQYRHDILGYCSRLVFVFQNLTVFEGAGTTRHALRIVVLGGDTTEPFERRPRGGRIGPDDVDDRAGSNIRLQGEFLDRRAGIRASGAGQPAGRSALAGRRHCRSSFQYQPDILPSLRYRSGITSQGARHLIYPAPVQIGDVVIALSG